MKNNNVLTLFSLAFCMILLSGCSVGMALSGKEEMNTSILYPGVPREAVISRIGDPNFSETDEEGNYIDTYTVVRGNEPSSTRAVIHGTLDIFTLGLWEIMGTPMEYLGGLETSSQLVIYYDSKNRIKKIQSTDTELMAQIKTDQEGESTNDSDEKTE